MYFCKIIYYLILKEVDKRVSNYIVKKFNRKWNFQLKNVFL